MLHLPLGEKQYFDHIQKKAIVKNNIYSNLSSTESK